MRTSPHGGVIAGVVALPFVTLVAGWLPRCLAASLRRCLAASLPGFSASWLASCLDCLPGTAWQWLSWPG